MNEVHEIFQQNFDQEAPPKQRFLKWEHKIFAIGNTKYKPRSGNPSERTWQSEFLEECVAKPRHISNSKQHM
jgi:hypothetical protein